MCRCDFKPGEKLNSELRTEQNKNLPERWNSRSICTWATNNNKKKARRELSESHRCGRREIYFSQKKNDLKLNGKSCAQTRWRESELRERERQVLPEWKIPLEKSENTPARAQDSLSHASFTMEQESVLFSLFVGWLGKCYVSSRRGIFPPAELFLQFLSFLCHWVSQLLWRKLFPWRICLLFTPHTFSARVRANQSISFFKHEKSLHCTRKTNCI